MGMLGKLLLLLLLAMVVVGVIQKRRNERLRLQKKPQTDVKKMVRCPVCGVHFAEVDGVWVSGKSYCSLKCAQKAENANKH